MFGIKQKGPAFALNISCKIFSFSQCDLRHCTYLETMLEVLVFVNSCELIQLIKWHRPVCRKNSHSACLQWAFLDSSALQDMFYLIKKRVQKILARSAQSATAGRHGFLEQQFRLDSLFIITALSSNLASCILHLHTLIQTVYLLNSIRTTHFWLIKDYKCQKYGKRSD